jgi:hypothetical protein
MRMRPTQKANQQAPPPFQMPGVPEDSNGDDIYDNDDNDANSINDDDAYLDGQKATQKANQKAPAPFQIPDIPNIPEDNNGDNIDYRGNNNANNIDDDDDLHLHHSGYPMYQRTIMEMATMMHQTMRCWTRMRNQKQIRKHLHLCTCLMYQRKTTRWNVYPHNDVYPPFRDAGGVVWGLNLYHHNLYPKKGILPQK